MLFGCKMSADMFRSSVNNVGVMLTAYSITSVYASSEICQTTSEKPTILHSPIIFAVATSDSQSSAKSALASHLSLEKRSGSPFVVDRSYFSASSHVSNTFISSLHNIYFELEVTICCCFSCQKSECNNSPQLTSDCRS